MMFAGLKNSLGEYKKWVDAEEKASVNPVAHQQFKKVKCCLTLSAELSMYLMLCWLRLLLLLLGLRALALL
jgi:hypothetical protein